MHSLHAYTFHHETLFRQFDSIQKSKSPAGLTAGLLTKAVIHRWNEINTDSGKVNSSRLKRKLFT